MRFTPGRLRSLSTSKALAPSGRIDTIASGHSGDGTNARISDAPHTSTATNAANPHANAIAMPRRRRRGRSSQASSGRTAKAGHSANSTATNATKSASAHTTTIVPQSMDGPVGNATGSAATYIASAPSAIPQPTSSPTIVAASESDSAQDGERTPVRLHGEQQRVDEQAERQKDGPCKEKRPRIVHPPLLVASESTPHGFRSRRQQFSLRVKVFNVFKVFNVLKVLKVFHLLRFLKPLNDLRLLKVLV